LRLGFRGGLFLLSLFLFVPAGAGVGFFLETNFRDTLEERLKENLLAHARSAHMLLEQIDHPDVDTIDPLADRIGTSIGARVTVVAPSGIVLGDSELDAGEVAAMDSHARRPEIVEALETGRGISRRFSDTLGTHMLYVAIPGTTASHLTVRVALPLTRVAELSGRLRWASLFAGIIGLAIAVALSGVTAHLLSGRLRELAEHARTMSKGRGRRRKIPPRESLFRIAEALDTAVGDLAADRDRFETVLDAMTDGVVVVDESNRITLSNPTAKTLLDVTSDLAGRPLLEVVRTPGLADLADRVRRRGEPAEGEIEIGAQPRILEVSGAQLQETGGVVLVLHDVTDLRRLERVRSDFVANVSHELRTPVSVIRANAETLVDGGLEDPVRGPEFAGAVLRNAERLASLIDDLLDLARFESRELESPLESVEVAVAVQRAFDVVNHITADREIGTSADVPADLHVRADAAAFDQIVLNLIANAVKYTHRRGQVSVSAGRDGDRVRLEVADDGPGIAPPERDRVFERFYRVDPGRSREVGGTGLGLSIVKHLTEAMDGRVGVDPVVPHGARFWVTLPVADTTREQG
jgi:two-component system phosphate regulon sensor histidine kinase PhoR